LRGRGDIRRLHQRIVVHECALRGGTGMGCSLRGMPFLDFFAGSGLVCEGLKPFFRPVWANDNSAKKAAVFLANHSKRVFHSDDIEDVKGLNLPAACLSWASFPCQDLSLAGKQQGISSKRSGLVWEWLRVMDEMPNVPPVAVAENVVGLVSSRSGAHYRELHSALLDRGYKAGAVLMDASHWVPQSRKRVFVIAAKNTLDTARMESAGPTWAHPPVIQRAADGLCGWVWWRIPEPPKRRVGLDSIVDFSAPCDEDAKRRHLL